MFYFLQDELSGEPSLGLFIYKVAVGVYGFIFMLFGFAFMDYISESRAMVPQWFYNNITIFASIGIIGQLFILIKGDRWRKVKSLQYKIPYFLFFFMHLALFAACIYIVFPGTVKNLFSTISFFR